MSHKRGIPEPNHDIPSLVSSVEALKESVESDAQGIRDRELPSVNRARALREWGGGGTSASQRKIDAIT